MPNRVFVLGGAASGKSAWAETYAESRGGALTYLATGRVLDDEMRTKVRVHQKRRDSRWHTIEAPFDPAPALATLGEKDIVLLDCTTMWLSNHLMDNTDISKAQKTLVTALRACKAQWIIVSNEVGGGIVPENTLARRFREAQGRLNIVLASEATVVVQVVAGLPQVLKGTLS